VKRALLAALVAGCAAPDPRPEADRPNIVLILADDLGWTDAGCCGSGFYRTPNLDRLAREGMQFSAAYANGPNCAPTRACLLTGRATPRHGVYTVASGARGEADFRRLIPVENREALPTDEVTIAQTLRAAGYATGHFGKWHLGDGREHHPARRGFDEAIVTERAHHFAPHYLTIPKSRASAGTYLADHVTDLALSFIDRHRAQPFFLHVAHFAVHAPIQALPGDTAAFANELPHGGHSDPVYAGMIAALDRSVGRIVARLAALGLDQRTLVVFTSDNGGVGGYPGLPGAVGGDITGNAPLRGGKGMLYEGGVRVPLLARWPDRVAAGSLCLEPVQLFDLHPTFQELAGARQPHDRALDGVSLAPLLDGATRLQRERLFWHFPGYLEADPASGAWRTTPVGAVREGRFKLLEFFEDDRVELYDLVDDIGERRDLAAAMPERAAELRARLARWRADLVAPMPLDSGSGSAPLLPHDPLARVGRDHPERRRAR
jgi:arylsulfatase A-like enzyme